jgi:hypothetical protein
MATGLKTLHVMSESDQPGPSVIDMKPSSRRAFMAKLRSVVMIRAALLSRAKRDLPWLGVLGPCPGFLDRPQLASTHIALHISI